MATSNPESGTPSPDPLDHRLAARLRQIAEVQRAPDDLRARVFADLAQEQVRPRRLIRWDLAAAAFGGALISAAAALAIWIAAPPNRGATEAAPAAWFDVALSPASGEASLQTDRPDALRDWLEARVSHELDVPAIPDAQLLGGRLAYVDGMLGASVEYTMHDMPLTYLMVPEGALLDAFASSLDTLATWASRGYQIVMWRQGGSTRALVAPMPRDELIAIAEHCRKTMI